ncbi:Cap15 family cyclic dinucleotide receptor domain-containing protein [Streptococcus intermedius]
MEQSFFTVKVKLKTSESSSNSITASIVNDNGTQKLIYTYLNNPRAELQSPIHYGTVIIDIDNPNRLEGNYYTGRKTRGSMRFETNNHSE